ncbi:MAG TPA: HAMP domain-containing sensor histidine kinase [Streptosporangiaceae bacterium]|jgi:signal transduction histidine kinase
MARRIAMAVLALITVLLAVVAIPLGLLISAQDRQDFRTSAKVAATSVANVAEERLDDHIHGSALSRSIQEMSRQGDQLAVYDSAGHLIASSAQRPPVNRSVRPAVRTQITYPLANRLVVLAPVVPDSSHGSVGTVALSRSTACLNRRIMVLWSLIAGVAAAGLLAAALVAIGLARWLSRPITTLAGAAHQLGEGALHTRTHVTTGPPEAQHLSEAFDTMATRIESLVRGHQALMADVSHQVRTPLAALRLRLDLLAQDADEGTAAELAGAQEEIARLARMTNGLLAVARAENNTVSVAVVDVAAVVRERCDIWRPVADERDVALGVATGDLLLARLGQDHLEQILDNLLANALDVLPSGGMVTVTVQADGPRAQLVVRDNGRGMSGQQQRMAFRRFTTGADGTGLGLAIVDRLATANGGSANLSDTPGGGLTVTIYLPRYQVTKDLKAADPAASAVPSGDSGGLNQS